jgi:hypothetical protein
MYNEQEIEIDRTMEAWMTSKRFTQDATANAAVRLRVLQNLEKLGGYPSIASWERAYLELRAENAIPEFRGSVSEHPAEAPAVTLSAEEYRRLSATVAKKNYRTDHPKGFRAAVDKLLAEGRI